MKSKRKTRGKKKVKYLKICNETVWKIAHNTEILFKMNTSIKIFIFQLMFFMCRRSPQEPKDYRLPYVVHKVHVGISLWREQTQSIVKQRSSMLHKRKGI